jgi:hypothetical protein
MFGRNKGSHILGDYVARHVKRDVPAEPVYALSVREAIAVARALEFDEADCIAQGHTLADHT